MQALRFYTPYLKGCALRLCTLQALLILRPISGGVGFMLIIPLLSVLKVAAPPNNELLANLLDWLPVFDNLAGVLIVLMVLLVFIALIGLAEEHISESVAQSFLINLRSDLHQKLLTTTWVQLMGTHPADYTRIIIEDTEAVSGALEELFTLAHQILLIVVYTGFCLLLSVELTLLAALLGVVLLLINIPVQRLSYRAGERQLARSEALFRQTGDQLRGMKSIKASRREEAHQRLFSRAAKGDSQATLKYTNLAAISKFVYSVMGAATFCLLAWFAADKIDINTSSLVILAVIFSRILPQISGLQTQLQRLSYLGAELASVTDLINFCNAHQESDDTGQQIDFSSGIRVNNVKFRYPAADRNVFTKLNIDLPGTGLIAVVGPSGAGKSTLADLLGGMLIPADGTISSGGEQLQQSNQRAWRRHIAYLPQEPFLFDTTLRDNLTMMIDRPIADKEIGKQLVLASCGFVHQLPDGLNTVIGDSGHRLSGGERQRLLLCRALLMDKTIMILDESTSQLDLDNEAHFLAACQNLKQDRLIIVISHRTSISSFADKVINLDEAH